MSTPNPEPDSDTDTNAIAIARAGSEKVAVLVTDLYDDAATVEAAIEISHENINCVTVNLHPENMTDDHWNDVVKLVLSAAKVITV